MDRKRLEQFLADGLSTRAIAKTMNCSQVNVRYWLKQYSLLTKITIKRQEGQKEKHCRVCGKDITKQRRDRCGACDTRVRRMRTKLVAIELLGGECMRCGWRGLPAGYDFHHVSGIKEFDIGQVSNKAWASIEAELMKCTLLCRNCHAIIHSKNDDEHLMKEVLAYRKPKKAEEAIVVNAAV